MIITRTPRGFIVTKEAHQIRINISKDDEGRPFASLFYDKEFDAFLYIQEQAGHNLWREAYYAAAQEFRYQKLLSKNNKNRD